ncbi:hypothetical protein [Labilibaculum euxinus]
MILNHDNLIDDFSKHFNSRLTSLDFINNAQQLLDLLKKQPENSFMSLPCMQEEIFNQLHDFDYQALLKEICDRIILCDEFIENFTSEMQVELVTLYIAFINEFRNKLSVIPNQEKLSFDIHGSELLIDLTISSFSLFHTELTSQLDYFNQLIRLNNGYTENLFLNSKASTSYSYFIMAYLAENLNIKLEL